MVDFIKLFKCEYLWIDGIILKRKKTIRYNIEIWYLTETLWAASGHAIPSQYVCTIKILILEEFQNMFKITIHFRYANISQLSLVLIDRGKISKVFCPLIWAKTFQFNWFVIFHLYLYSNQWTKCFDNFLSISKG